MKLQNKVANAKSVKNKDKEKKHGTEKVFEMVSQSGLRLRRRCR